MELRRGARSWIVGEGEGAGGNLLVAAGGSVQTPSIPCRQQPLCHDIGSSPCVMTFPASLKQSGSSPACPGFLGINGAESRSGSLPFSQAVVSLLCDSACCGADVGQLTWHRSWVTQSAANIHSLRERRGEAGGAAGAGWGQGVQVSTTCVSAGTRLSRVLCC